MSNTAPPQCSKKGFTLIELLVVISIIAILSVIGITVFSGVQKNARISKRIADLKAIQTSLEIYYYAHNSTYPKVAGWRTECSGWIGGLAADDVVVDSVSGDKLVPQYMASFPADPAMNKTGNESCYLYYSDGTDYEMMAYNIREMSAADFLKYPSFGGFYTTSLQITTLPRPQHF